MTNEEKVVVEKMMAALGTFLEVDELDEVIQYQAGDAYDALMEECTRVDELLAPSL